MLSGGGNADEEPQEEGAKMGAEGDFGENTLDKIAEGNGRVLWLQRLISMENVPANVRETLGLQLRGALKTETEVQLLQRQANRMADRQAKQTDKQADRQRDTHVYTHSGSFHLLP